MQRTQILLEDWQYQALKSESERKRRSLSSLVRDLVSRHLARRAAEGGLEDIVGIAKGRRNAGKEHDDVLYGRRPRKGG